MNQYECTTCTKKFDNFPAAHKHELATKFQHLTVGSFYESIEANLTVEVVTCSLEGCNEELEPLSAVWDPLNDDPYCCADHMAQGQKNRWGEQ